MTTTQINLNEKTTGPLGQWATLRFDPHGGYVPGLGPQGVYFVEHWAPWFSGTYTERPAEMISSRDKTRAVRALKQWIALTEVPPPVQ